MDYPMMMCGHQANSIQTLGDGTEIPACVICSGLRNGHNVVADPQPDLSERRARCTYWGSTPHGQNHESNHGCKRGEPCKCEVSSGEGHLAFFEHRPQEAFDAFYCGCWGWD